MKLENRAVASIPEDFEQEQREDPGTGPMDTDKNSTDVATAGSGSDGHASAAAAPAVAALATASGDATVLQPEAGSSDFVGSGATAAAGGAVLDDGEALVIDGRLKGNVTRFVNHSVF
eukprot:SAG11_NODE_924_length_6525_cov_5.604264_7_plen_118_part_00